MMLCPLPGTDAFQVQASPEVDADGTPLPPSLENFQRTFDRVAGVPGVRLHDLGWRSTYRVNVRMVDRLRVDRVFLAGDAAHVHPIAGGLGMNTGIQDAYNLGWKLGLVITGGAGPDLLDTYDEERLPVASWLLDITSARLAAVLDAIKKPGGGVDAVATPETSQLGLGYRWSRLARDVIAPAGGLRAGDRAPDAPCRDAGTGSRVRLFDAFRGPHFTLIRLDNGLVTTTTITTTSGKSWPQGAADGTTSGKLCDAGPRGSRELVDDDGHAARAYGEHRLVLVRPDGYVALVAPADDADAVPDYLGAL
jgi:hypothetical protein